MFSENNHSWKCVIFEDEDIRLKQLPQGLEADLSNQKIFTPFFENEDFSSSQNENCL